MSAQHTWAGHLAYLQTSGLSCAASCLVHQGAGSMRRQSFISGCRAHTGCTSHTGPTPTTRVTPHVKPTRCCRPAGLFHNRARTRQNAARQAAAKQPQESTGMTHQWGVRWCPDAHSCTHTQTHGGHKTRNAMHLTPPPHSDTVARGTPQACQASYAPHPKQITLSLLPKTCVLMRLCLAALLAVQAPCTALCSYRPSW